jgi:hypothetical protein
VLAYTALENTAMLSGMATVLYRSSPHAGEHLEKIVASYATAAAMNVLWF